MPGREVDVEISHSHVALRSISIRHAARADRGALTVWADHDLAGIEISDCDVSFNCGRGIWFDGPAGNSIHDVSILANEFRSNDGSGALLILSSGGKIAGNKFFQNCRREIEPWQAGIRLWSSGISNLEIRDNTIADQKWGHDHDSSMGIHCDETGAGVILRGNTIRNVDHAGIEVENTRGVTIEKNRISGCNIGILLNRAGHNHVVRGNTVHDSRAQGIAIQGWSAHGVDAQAEILVEGRFFTRNLIEDNLCTGSHWGNLKAVGGGEQIDQPLGNIYRNNDFGPERSGFIEWGDRKLDRYDQWPIQARGTNAGG
jgi:parallel beta-helix repeat protein